MNNVYNDGQIHGWNGGDCPVHPETVVGYWLRAGFAGEGTAKYWGWDHKDSDNDIIAFRVVKQHVEPARPAASKVIWVVRLVADETILAFTTKEKDAWTCAGLDPENRRVEKYQEVKE